MEIEAVSKEEFVFVSGAIVVGDEKSRMWAMDVMMA